MKFWDFNSMDSSCRAFRTLQPFECHQIKSIQYSQTGDSVLIAAGNTQVSMLYCRSILLIPVTALWPIYTVRVCPIQPPYDTLTTLLGNDCCKVLKHVLKSCNVFRVIKADLHSTSLSYTTPLQHALT